MQIHVCKGYGYSYFSDDKLQTRINTIKIMFVTTSENQPIQIHVQLYIYIKQSVQFLLLLRWSADKQQ